MILSESKHAIPNDKRISTSPATELNTMGIANVHFTIPSELKNSDISGLIARQLTIMPITVEIIIVGINERAVCKISCFVVKPNDFSIP